MPDLGTCTECGEFTEIVSWFTMTAGMGMEGCDKKECGDCYLKGLREFREKANKDMRNMKDSSGNRLFEAE